MLFLVKSLKIQKTFVDAVDDLGHLVFAVVFTLTAFARGLDRNGYVCESRVSTVKEFLHLRK